MQYFYFHFHFLILSFLLFSDATKPFPKSSRSGWERPANFNSKNEQQNRRPLPQKNKALDKRPRPRGQDQSSGKQDSEVGNKNIQFHISIPASSKLNTISFFLFIYYLSYG